MISDEELAAVAVALATLNPADDEPRFASTTPISRWKLAARYDATGSDDVFAAP